jgi:3-methyladenine DNA glycosylase Mpg
MANVEHYTGTDDQAASAALIAYFADASKWNASCTLAGIAYTYVTWSGTRPSSRTAGR